MNHQTSCRTTSRRTNPTFMMSSKHVNSCRTQFALRFIHALQRIKAATTTTTTTTTTSAKTLQQQQQQQQQRRTRLIKLASDASMASTVGARRVWSRAVLVKIKNRARFNGLEKKKNKKKKKKRVTTIRASSQKKKKMIIKRRQINGNLSVIKRSDELRRLVPGGEGMDFCRLLGETAHYIECLNTQVQVMQSLVDAQKPSN